MLLWEQKPIKNFWERNNEGKWERLKPWMKVYSSRQVRQTIVREDTGLACASRTFLWRSGRRIGDNVYIIENEDDFSFIDIHSEDDLLLAEAALKIRDKMPNKMFEGTPAVSIIIRTKNEERWIGLCLEAIFKQSYKNFEIIWLITSQQTRQ